MADVLIPSPSFDLNAALGLSDAEAARRLQADGPNELPSAKPRSVLAIALDVVREPMFLLLVASGAIYLALGDSSRGSSCWRSSSS